MSITACLYLHDREVGRVREKSRETEGNQSKFCDLQCNLKEICTNVIQNGC